MQMIKKVLGTLIRLTIVDGSIIILAWIEGTASYLRHSLSGLAINSSADSLLGVNSMKRKLLEMEGSICDIVAVQVKESNECISEMESLIAKVNVDFYEEEPEDTEEVEEVVVVNKDVTYRNVATLQ